MSSRRGYSKRRTVTRTETVLTGELVRLDSEGIRRKFLSSCRRARSTFETAERELQEFETKVVPAYERWRRSVLGPAIQEVEELRGRREESALKLDTLHHLMLEYGCTPREALAIYERMRKAREEPENDVDREERERLKERLAEEQARQQRQQEEAFESLEEAFGEFLEECRDQIAEALAAGVDREELLREVLAEFCYQEGLPPEVLMQLVQRDPVRRLLIEAGLVEDSGPGETSEPEANTAVRIKQLARELAFALHPDQCGEHDDEKLALWHRVQAAVKAKDLDELEVLHAHVQLVLGDVSPNVSVSRLQDLTEMYRRSRAALRRQIRKFRKLPAWEFFQAKQTERENLRRKLERELREEREGLVMELREIQSELDAFTDPAFARRQRRMERFEW